MLFRSAAFEQRLAVFQRLSTTFPDEPRFQNDLAASYEQIGETMLALERLDDALAAHRACLAVRESQASAEPDDLQRLRDVWLANLSVGHVLGLLDRPADALEYYGKSLALAKKFTSMKGIGDGWRMLVMTEQRIGDSSLALGLQQETLAAYRRGIDILRKQLAVDPQNGNAREKLQTNLAKMGFAQLALGNPEGALSFYEDALTLAPRDAVLHRDRGLAAFQAGRFAAAIESLTTAVKIDPKNAYSVLWLHLARSRVGHDDAPEFAANARGLDRTQWSWSLVAHYLGKLDADKLVASAAVSEDAKTRREQTCEANFYIGSMQAKGKVVEAQSYLRSAARECPKDFVEYAAANAELKRLDGAAAARRK